MRNLIGGNTHLITNMGSKLYTISVRVQNYILCLEDFKILSNSSEPFFCRACTVRKQNDTINLLRSDIEVLRNEVVELRAVVTSLCSNVTPPDQTCLEAAQVQTKKSSSECSDPPWNVVVRRKNGRGKGGNGGSGGIGGSGGNGRNGGIVGNGGIGGSGGIRGIGVSGGIGGSDRVNRDGQPQHVPVNSARKIWGTVKYTRIQVEGKRKVWGTMKTCSTAAVKSAISTLTNVPSDELSIRRKYKIATTNAERVVKWWFVIGGEERVIAQLEEQWPTVNFQTKWKLEPVYCYSEASQPDQPDQTRNITEPPMSPPPSPRGSYPNGN